MIKLHLPLWSKILSTPEVVYRKILRSRVVTTYIFVRRAYFSFSTIYCSPFCFKSRILLSGGNELLEIHSRAKMGSISMNLRASFSYAVCLA